jgi:hypothetical protein
LLVAVLAGVTKTHRSSALRSLRAAIASGDASRIRAAIWRAQAAGVSVEEVATTQELRAAVSGKLQSALVDGDVDKLSSAVRCAQAAAIAGDMMYAAVDMLREIGNGQRQRQNALVTVSTSRCLGGSEATAQPAELPVVWTAAALTKCHSENGASMPKTPFQKVGMTLEEVAFAEEVLCCSEQDQKPPQVVHRTPPNSLHAQQMNGDDCSMPEELHELHKAVEAGDATHLRAAIARARAAHVSAEEVTLAEAVLQIEETRLQRAALHRLRQAMQRFNGAGAQTTIAPVAPLADDVERLRGAVHRARAAGVSTDELMAAEAVLLDADARVPQLCQAALKIQSAGRIQRDGGASRKRVTFADDVLKV